MYRHVILSLDADEELSPQLQDQIRTLLPTNPPVDAYYLKRRNLFLDAGSSMAASIRPQVAPVSPHRRNFTHRPALRTGLFTRHRFDA